MDPFQGTFPSGKVSGTLAQVEKRANWFSFLKTRHVFRSVAKSGLVIQFSLLRLTIECIFYICVRSKENVS